MYLYRMEGSSLKEGEKYTGQVTKLITFNNFKNEKIPELAVGNYRLMDPITKDKKNDIESYEIYLPIFHKMSYNEIEDKINKRLYLLGVKDMEEIKKLNVTDENLKIIKEYERLINEDDRFGLIYDTELDQKKTINTVKRVSFNEGMEKGLEQGEKQANIETAKNLLKLGINTIEQIASVTKLSIKEIEKLKKEL